MAAAWRASSPRRGHDESRLRPQGSNSGTGPARRPRRRRGAARDLLYRILCSGWALRSPYPLPLTTWNRETMNSTASAY